jgi:hypothetical protein
MSSSLMLIARRTSAKENAHRTFSLSLADRNSPTVDALSLEALENEFGVVMESDYAFVFDVRQTSFDDENYAVHHHDGDDDDEEKDCRTSKYVTDSSLGLLLTCCSSTTMTMTAKTNVNDG